MILFNSLAHYSWNECVCVCVFAETNRLKTACGLIKIDMLFKTWNMHEPDEMMQDSAVRVYSS